MMSRIIKMDALTDFNAMCTAIAEAREAMRTAIEAREKPEIVHIFVQAKQHIHAQAKASEIYFEETKNGEAKRKAREARLDAECLMGQWLGVLEETKLRFMGQPPKGRKIGAPPDPALITLDDLNLDGTESKQFQAVAKLSPAEFAAFVASDKPTSALIQRLPEKRVLPLSAIRADGQAQPRVSMKTDLYVEEMSQGVKFPPIVVFEDSEGVYWLADGFHRYRAAVKLKRENIKCEVHHGGLREAILHAAGANAAHGLRRTNEDKRHTVTRLLKDKVWSGWSNVEISKRCRVSDEFVRKLRQQLELVTSNIGRENERTYTDKHGNTATMRTGNIGRSRAQNPESENEPSEQEPAQPQLVLLPQKSPEPAPEAVSREPMFGGDVLQTPSLAPKVEAASPIASTGPASLPDLHGLHCVAVLHTIRGTIRGLTDQVAAIPDSQLLEVRSELEEVVKTAGELRALITRAIESATVGAA